MRFEKRRSDWRLGRWTAKHALVAYLDTVAGFSRRLIDIEISNDASGAPHARYDSEGENCVLSISHRGGAALCVVAPATYSVGCDLELVEQRSPEFVGDYFTATERCFVHDAAIEDRACLTALIWSAKESSLKALAIGLRVDTRAVEIVRYGWQRRALDSWQPLLVRSIDEPRSFDGWWCVRKNRVLTMLAAPQAGAPVRLRQKNAESWSE